ncbi:MAG: glycine oxidase ThiO [Candidatus Thiodiazotropha sp. (ex Myrtea sp. 'scaly one' KF741663)]|nr:glycine oxidase ThiO [Candidatus Thiodiazotropha sp. (ex Myrtea sp. 'scaly one' KF741663)]
MSEIFVIGGGLIGMLTARELAMAGKQVTLLEQNRVGRESSWAGGGIISPLYPWRYDPSITALASWGQHYYPELMAALYRESDIDPEYTRNGLLIVEPEDNEQALTWGKATQQSLTNLEKTAIGDCEPALTTTANKAIWMPEVAQVRNPRLVKAAYGAIEKRVEIRENCRVSKLLARDGRIQGLETDSGNIATKQVIVCAGAWTGDLLKDFVTRPEIEPVLGQMILFRSQPGVISRIVLHQDRYVIPRRDGRVLVGSTLEHRGFDKTTTQAAKEALKDYALAHFPLLREAKIEHHWAGLRPGSPSGIPYIGPVPGIEGLYLNAGHFRNGVVLGPASARLMSDLVLGREPILPSTPYALDAHRD